MLGGAPYVATWVTTILIYGVFEEQAKHTFFGQHAFIHMLDVTLFALLFVGAGAVYLRQKGSLGAAGKTGYYLTQAGFGLSVLGGLAIIVVGLLVSDEATLGVLDVVTHPLAMLLYSVGSLVFGISTYRAGVFPRAAALAMAVGPIWVLVMVNTGLAGPDQPLILLFAPVLVTALGWVWLGYALRYEEHAPKVVEPEPVLR